MSESDKINKNSAYKAQIEKALLGDLQLRRAYSDYMATRNVLQDKGHESMADLATTPLRFLRQRGRLDKLNNTAEDGSAAVKINVQVGGENEPWLLSIKTSNDVADCVEKAKEDRAHPYAALRLTAADAAEAASSSLKSAEEFAEYTARLCIATGAADEIYHPAFKSGRMESSAVIATVPAVDLVVDAVRSEEEEPEFEVSYVAKNEEGAAGQEDNDAGGISINHTAGGDWKKSPVYDESLGFSDGMRKLAEDINICSRRGLSERFDSTIGSGAVMMPLGGANQLTPMQAAVNKMPTTHGNTDDCTVAAWGFNPYIFDASPYHGAYLAVVESIAKLAAAGASFNEVYLALQQNFGADESESSKGKHLAALLGAFEAEMGLGVCSIGGDAVYEAPENGAWGNSESLVSFAMTTGKASEICSPEFKAAGHKVVMLAAETDEDQQSAYFGLPKPKSLISVWRKAYELIANGKAVAAYTPGIGGIAEAVMKMSYGNGIGFEFSGWEQELSDAELFGYSYGSIILEMAGDDPIKSLSLDIRTLGYTTEKHVISKGDEALSIGELLLLYEGRLESVFPSNGDSNIGTVQNASYATRSWPTPIYKRATPKVLIPKFGCTTGDTDVARAVGEAGGAAGILEMKGGGTDAEAFAQTLSEVQILCLPSGGEGLSDEIVSLLKTECARAALSEFIDKKDGLVLGLGAGFKALIELGLLPGERISVNNLGAFQSRIARVRIASNKSPWFRDKKAGEVYMIPVATAEGRYEANEEIFKKMAINGQIAAQFADRDGKASSDIRFNPGGSMMAVEAVTSEDGRVLGRIGCADRIGRGFYRNVPGEYYSGMFENAMRYYR